MAPKLVNALARQRVLAKMVDALVPAVAVLVAYLLGGGPAALLMAGGLTLLYWIAVLVWEASTGRTPGNLALGLATVSAAGTPPGFIAVLVRALALGLASIVPVIGPLVLLVSHLWDRDGQRRSWHDKPVGTYVLDVRTGRDPLRSGGLDGALAQAGFGGSLSADSGEGRQDHALAGGGPSARATADSPLPDAGPASPAPLSGWAPHSAGTNTPAAEAAERPPVASGSATSGFTPTADTRAPVGDVTASAASSPGNEASDAIAPPLSREAAVGAAAHDAAGGPDAPLRVLVFDDGTEVEIAGQSLIGRNPEPRPGESVNYLINFADLNRSVSKTHVHVGFDHGAVWVTDRGSTNGSAVVDHKGTEQPLHPEVAMLLPSGCSVRFGDRRFTIR